MTAALHALYTCGPYPARRPATDPVLMMLPDFCFFHDRSRVFDAHEDAAQENADSVVKPVHGCFLDAPGYAAVSGVVKQAIQASKVRDSEIDHRFDIGFPADRRRVKDGVSSEFCCEGLAFVFLNIRNDDARRLPK